MSASNTNEDPLAVATIVRILADIVSPQSPSHHESGAELIVLTLHAAMLSLGFRFVGLGESGVPAEHGGEESGVTRLPNEWNATGDTFSFRYRHSQSTFTFLIKTIKLGPKLLVHGIAVQDGMVHNMEVTASDFVSPLAQFPLTTATPSGSDLLSAFSSEIMLKELINLYKTSIIQKLIPGLNKPGYEERGPTTTTGTQTFQNQDRPRPPYDPRAFDPLREPPRMPRFDPYGGGQPYNPYGDIDLDPLAASPGLIPPGGGRFLPGGGGMHIGPNHPMFGGGGGGFGGGRGGFGGGDRFFPSGGPGTLPYGGVPPGARYDPIGPFGAMPTGPGGPRPQRGPGGMGRGSGHFSGEPDNDEMPPPGSHDMFL
ncbi:PI31 proteasome regulator N-terminal-domain-containing protein [Cladochytrium replicatum]|nr:PI31 proteasome regulator N-terminal-domain-containing protein [Cladochytrium replicatum]